MRVSKEDEHDAKVFKRVVMRLHNTCKDLIKFLTSPDGFKIDDAALDKIIQMSDSIYSLADIYAHNKFASPSVTFNIIDLLNDTKHEIAEFGDVIMHVSRLNAMTCRMSEDAIEETSVIEEITQFNKLSESILNRLVISIVSDMNCMIHVISYDHERCMSNVDIIRDYKRCQRETKLGSINNIEYVIKFKKHMPINPSQDPSNKKKEGVSKHE